MKPYLLPLLALAFTASYSRAEIAAASDTGVTLTFKAAASSSLESLALEMVALEDRPAATTDFSLFSGDTDSAPQPEADMAAIYHNAVKAQRLARLKKYLKAEQLVRAERKAIFEAANKSLVELEKERAEAGRAIPEASPAPTPFTLSRPENFVSTGDSFQAVTGDLQIDRLAATPEPATWALFGLGGAMLIFIVPRRSAKDKTSSPSNKR